MDPNQIDNLSPILIGIILAIVGWLLRRFTKSGLWSFIGIILIIAGAAIVISEVLGFHALWAGLAWLLGFLGGIFQGLASLCKAGQEALQRL